MRPYAAAAHSRNGGVLTVNPDNGPEFNADVVSQWLSRSGVDTLSLEH